MNEWTKVWRASGGGGRNLYHKEESCGHFKSISKPKLINLKAAEVAGLEPCPRCWSQSGITSTSRKSAPKKVPIKVKGRVCFFCGGKSSPNVVSKDNGKLQPCCGECKKYRTLPPALKHLYKRNDTNGHNGTCE